MSSRTITAVASAGLLSVGLLTVAVPAPAAATPVVTTAASGVLQPASVANGVISRQEILLRSASWIRDKVPYSQDNNSPHVNEFGSYRRDCSGFVSMAWHLGSSMTTGSLPSVMTPISYEDLQPGDALHRSGHIGLFVGWYDTARTRPKVREEYDWGKIAEERIWTNSYLRTFRAYRYKKVVGATTSPGSSVGQDVTGQLAAFTATPDGAVQLRQQTTPAGTSWETSVIDPPGGVVPGGPIATTPDSIGRVTYLAVTPDRKLRFGWQTTPGAGPWLSATIEPTTDHDGIETVHPVGKPALSIDARGKLTYFVRTSDGRILHGWQQEPGSQTWHATIIRDQGNQPVAIAGDPVVSHDVLGRVAFLARNTDGSLRYGRQAAPGTGPWLAWTLTAGSVTGEPSIGLDVSGKLAYFARNPDGKLLHGWQTTPGADAWASTLIEPTTDSTLPSAPPQPTQALPSAPPQPTQALPSAPPQPTQEGVQTVQLAGDPAITMDDGGKLTYFVRTTDNRVLHGWQHAPGTDPWHATIIRDAGTNQPIPATTDPLVYADSAGKLTFFTGNTVAYQHAPGTGPWHTTALL